jgi:hypothetical protein
MAKSIDFDFELNLLFDVHKNPVEAFSQIGKMYEKLIEFDRFILYNILPNANLEYELVDIEFSSIKTKVIQLLNAVPDEVLKDIASPKKMIGLALVYAKHRILKAIENNEVDSKNKLELVSRDINKKINDIPLQDTLILDVNNYFILNTINDICLESTKLKKLESIEYKSKYGNSNIVNSKSPNMSKILFELGDQKIEQKRIETLKIKSLDLLSDRANWKLIRLGKQIEVRMLDKEWLEKYHNRQIPIQPNDYLKMELKITYTSNNQSKKPLIHFESLKIYEVIPPNKIESESQINLF